MLYSSAGVLALIIHLIINHDMLWHRSESLRVPAHRAYHQFLVAVSVYYVTDVFWGMFYEHSLVALTFIDTAIYFASMAFSILLWTRFVTVYLNEKNVFSRMLQIIGALIFAFQMFFLVANFFIPVLYSFDETGAYHTQAARYITLVAQIAMFMISAVYSLIVAFRRCGTVRVRHRTIGLSSLVMAAFITGQAYFPLLPLYAIGCMLSSCLLHSFVLENEKEEYRDDLERRLQENILKGNYYDLLTGLPGMTYFFERVQLKRAEALRRGHKPAFLFFNLSGMKFYNQSHGFSEGDRLLRDFSERLAATFGSDNCSRFGQDHFAVFAEALGLDALKGLFEGWDGPAIMVGVYNDDGGDTDISTAYDRAKIACDAIRTTYVSSIKLYDATMFTNAERQQYIIGHLDQALREGWIQVYYQPIVRALNGRVCDEEALARWIDPVRGFMPPDGFIPILEDAKLIYKLDLYVVDRVLEKIKRTQEAGLFLVPQSINLSRADFDACDVVQEIVDRVDAAGLPHSLLTIEITESIIGSDFDFMKAQVERFRSLGFPVWMDDFGSGYSSLDVLQSIQVDLIKFDMRFMQQFSHEAKSRIILAELMKMAIGLGVDTVCEGVERQDQMEFLREIGCSKLQGYLFTKPLPLDEIFRRYETGLQIGFENPGESDYFDAVGRINLYDLAVIAREDEDDLRHYFNTVPMAIIEILDGKSRFIRSNPSYRDFMIRTFRVDLAAKDKRFEITPEGPGKPFIEMLIQLSAEGGRSVFDAALPDGTKVHAFLRRIAENPLTGGVAVAVAVLAVGDAQA